MTIWASVSLPSLSSGVIRVQGFSHPKGQFWATVVLVNKCISVCASAHLELVSSGEIRSTCRKPRTPRSLMVSGACLSYFRKSQSGQDPWQPRCHTLIWRVCSMAYNLPVRGAGQVWGGWQPSALSDLLRVSVPSLPFLNPKQNGCS